MNWRAKLEDIAGRLASSPLWWGGLVVYLFLANAIALLQTPTNGDVAWYLYAIRRISEGAVLYRDIHDINLPIVYLVHLPFGWVSTLTGIPIQILLYVFLWAALASFLFWFTRLVEFDFFTRAVMVFGVACAFLTINRFHTGQRDTVCGLLFAGFYAAIYTRIEHPECANRWTMWAATLAASVAMAFKPYFLGPWLVAVAYLAWRRNGLRLSAWNKAALTELLWMQEVWMPPLVSVASWVITLTVFPGYLEMASFARRYYGFLNSATAWNYFPLLFPVVTAAIALRRPMPAHSRLTTLVQLAALTTLAFAFESIVQMKGSGYHMGPSFFWGAATFGLMHAQRLEDQQRQAPAFPRFWTRQRALVAAAAGFTVFSLNTGMAPPPNPLTPVDRFILEHGKGQVVLTMSVHPWAALPAILDAGAINARADASLWALAGMYQDQVLPDPDEQGGKVPARYHRRDEMSADERRYFEEVTQMVTERRPTIIVVETQKRKWGFGGLSFDFLDYFSTDERCRQALRSYQRGPSDKDRLLLYRDLQPQTASSR